MTATLVLDIDQQGVLSASLAAPFTATLDARRALASALRSVARDEAVRVIALHVGDVVGGPPSGDPASAAAEVEADIELARALIDLPVPVVAGISGRLTRHAEIALTADLIVAAEDAVFGDDAWETGSAPGGAAASLWQAALRPGRAASLLFGFRTISAEEGRSIGFVHEVPPAADLRSRLLAHAGRLADQPDLALRFTRATMTRRLRERLELETALGAALSRVARLGADGWTASAPTLAAAE